MINPVVDYKINMAKIKKSNPNKPQHTVTPWSINWPDFDQMFESFRKDFEHAFVSFPTISSTVMPKIVTRCDLVDDGNKLVAKIDLPGINKKDVNLNITENSLEVLAEHKDRIEEKQKNFLRKERSEVQYYRTLPLPEKIIPEKGKSSVK